MAEIAAAFLLFSNVVAWGVFALSRCECRDARKDIAVIKKSRDKALCAAARHEETILVLRNEIIKYKAAVAQITEAMAEIHPED